MKKQNLMKKLKLLMMLTLALTVTTAFTSSPASAKTTKIFKPVSQENAERNSTEAVQEQ